MYVRYMQQVKDLLWYHLSL